MQSQIIKELALDALLMVVWHGGLKNQVQLVGSVRQVASMETYSSLALKRVAS